MMRWGKSLVILFALLALGLGCAQSKSELKKKQTADAYYKLGVYYLEIGNYKQAISEFSRALKMNPNEPDYHFSMGTAYSLDGQDEEAIAQLKMTLKLNPNNSEAHNNLGYIYAKRQRWPEAMAEFKEALANPEYGRPHSAHLNLAQAYMQQAIQAGIEVRASESRLQSAEEKLRLAQSEREKKAAQAEIKRAQTALDLARVNVLNLLETSIEEYRKALVLKPDSEVAHSGLGRAYLQKGERDMAIEALEKSLKIKERQIDVLFDLAIAYLGKGDKENAATALKKVINLGPESPLGVEAKKQLEALEK